MEAIGLLSRLRTNKEELNKMEEKIITLEKEIAMIRQEIADFCERTENYEVVLGTAIGNGIAHAIKEAKYVSIFSTSLFANPDFADLVRGKRYGLFTPNPTWRIRPAL